MEIHAEMPGKKINHVSISKQLNLRPSMGPLPQPTDLINLYLNDSLTDLSDLSFISNCILDQRIPC